MLKTFLKSLAFIELIVGIAQAEITIEKPTCERIADPMGIDVASPKLFWQVQSKLRGELQSAYQILVATNSELLNEEKADLWNSGKVQSDQTTYVSYGGKPLTSSQTVYWSVRAWDREENPSNWSKPSKWTTGLLSLNDWKASWIKADKPEQSSLLRKSFPIKPNLKKAIVHVTGLGQYVMYCNGNRVGQDLLTPGWTNYRKTILYDTYDITELLKSGDNAIGLMLGNGMYKVERVPGRFAKFTGSFGEQKAILHLELQYADGSSETIGTDKTWKSRSGPITFNGIYSGEDYDARLNPIGWNKPGFDEKDWHGAVETGKPDSTLHGITRAANPIREIESHQPLNTKSFGDGSIVYDFGQNASIMPRITVTGPIGSTIRLIPSEISTHDGAILRSTTGGASRGAAWWQYTKSTDGPETWSPEFCYVGGRYLYAELLPPGQSPTPPNMQGIYPQPRSPATQPSKVLPQITSIEAVVVHSTASPSGTFKSSDPLLNQIRDIIRWSQRSNLMSLITDCPHREKLGWLEQLNMGGPSLRYEFDISQLFSKAEYDMADSQDASGLVPNIAPEYTTFKGTFRAAAEWGSSFISTAWQEYLYTGDAELLKTHYLAMKQYYVYLESKTDAEGILSEGLGDWYDLGPSKPGRAQLTPPPITATAFLYEDAVMLSQIASVLGHEDDAKAFIAKSKKVKADYLKKFYHADTGTFAEGSQCAIALPLAMGMVSDADKPRVIESLIKSVEANDFGQTTADVGFHYLLRALADNGRSDVAYRIITQDKKPGYARQVKSGETTLTESWDSNKTSSHNHFMLGHATEWMYHDLAGISADWSKPGFKNTIIKPQLIAGIASAQATHDSLYGTISVQWNHSDSHVTLDVFVPTNSTATVYVPSAQESAVAMNDRTGVTHLKRDGEYEVYQVESGQYQFQSTLKP